MDEMVLTPPPSRFADWRQRERVAPSPALGSGEVWLAADASQRRLWMQEQLEPGNGRYNCPHALRVLGPLQLPALEQALERLAQRHEALRSSFAVDAQGVLRRRVEPTRPTPLALVDVSAGALSEVGLQRLLRDLLARPFDLGTGPLWRAACVRLGPGEHVLCFSAHHAIVDDWSIGLLLRELTRDVAAMLLGHPLPLDAAPTAAPRTDPDRTDRSLAYWRERLAGVPVLLLPGDRARRQRPTRPAAKVFDRFPADLAQAIDTRARALGISAFSAYLTALRSVLSTWSRQQDFTIGLPAFDRPNGVAERQVGLAVNLLALRRSLVAEARFWPAAAEEFETVLAGLEHRDAPFDQVVEAVAADRVAGTDPLVQVMYAHHERDGGHFSVGACTFSPVDVVMPLARFELTLMTVRQRDGVSVSMEYDADLYDADSMQALLADLRQVLTVAAADANAPLRPPPHQPARLVGPPPALDRPAHSLATRLRHAFAARPDGVALRHEGAQYTCRWLSARAEGIARKLRQEGAGADTVVAIAMRRGPAQLAAACGAVMAGAAFALFDPDVPMERLLRLLGTLAPRWLLVSRQGPAPLAPAGIRILEVEGVPVAAPSREEPCWSPEGLAYVVATSGSTGQHKLIGVPWAALLNRLAWMQSVEPWYDDERAMSRTQTMFVDFICEAFAPLLGGVPLIMAGAEQLADAQALVALMRRERATRLVATPSLLRELAAVVRMRQNGGLPDLRVAVASGEALTAQDVALVRSLTAARLWNLYGSCEVAADATAALIATTLDATAPIGQPIAGMQAWLTDAQGQAVPARALGEIQLAGIGLARGYLGDPAATAAAFRPAPTHAGHGARAFVTGDHGRIDASGALHFAGREAGRVELRGIRVEIHEMEALLRDDPEVAQAAVVVVDVPRRAVARVLPRGQQLDAQALRRRLLARAPAYLVPSQIEVGELPRTPSGKIDYVALRQCPRSAPSEGPPATPDELALAAAWSEVLHCAVDDRGADFFALGGHSLAATRVARLLERRLGRTVPPALSLLTPILKEAALELAACPTSGSETIAPDAAHRFEPFPLHPLQAAYVAGRDAAFEGGGVSLHGYSEIEWPGVSVDAFEDALNVLIGRHDMLRAVLLEDLSQRVLPQVPRYRIERVDLRGLPLAQIEAGRARLRREMGAQVLDLRRWPSFDIRSSQVDAGPPRLHVSFDGVFVDAWSQSLLLREMVRILRDGDPGWRAPGLAYRDWLLHQAARRQSLSRERAWADWQARLAGLPDAPEMPRPERQPPAGPPRIAQIGVDIPPEVVQRLREQVAGDGNLVTVLLAAFAVVLGRWAASPRFLLNVPLSGRGTEHDDIDRLIGPFGDFTLVAFDLELTPGWRDLVRAARRELSWALERQQVSGMDLSRALREQRGGQVLTPIVFTSLNFETGTGAAPAESAFEELFSTGQTPQVHLDNRVRLLADGSVRIAWDVAVDQFPPGLPEAMLRVYEEVLHRAAQADWEQPLTLGDDPVPMSTSGHAHAQADAVPAPARLDAAFQAGVQRHARRAAVVFAGGQWSYEELWARVQGVAARLLAQGLGRGDVVAVALDKGPAQVAAVLGILHIGAAYAPLEPEHPAERLEALLVSLQARAVLVQARDVNAPWRATALAVPVEAAMAEGLAGAQARVEPVPDAAGQDAQALAYVIHTSGSTGRPKGVMISHAAAWATIAAVNERLALTPQDRVLSVSALGFDLSVWDLFGPLSVGAAVVMPDAQGARDPGAWLALAGQAGVTIWNSAPGLMGAVLERAGAGLRGLRWALLSGDFIPLGMPAAIRAGAPGCRVLSLGGATEAAIWSVWYEVAEVKPEWRSIPYGRALPGQQAYVVDARLRLCPSWVEGEIVIAGGGLAQGYWRQPQETAARFITHPRTGQRLYRTGDRGRYRADGEIEPLPHEPVEIPAPAPSTEVVAADAAVIATIREFLTARLNLLELLPEDRLISMGADSMVLLDLAAEVEQRHGRQLHIPTLFANPTVEEIVTLAHA